MKKKIIIGIIGIVSVGAIFGIVRAARTPAATTLVAVTRGSIASTVGLTGTVEAAATADLAFERTGKIVRVPVRIGDRVTLGQELAALDASDIRAQLAQASAARDAARARLAQLQKGTRAEEVAIAQTRVTNAQTELANATAKARVDIDNAYDKTKDTLSDAYTKTEDAVRVKTLGMFTGSSVTYRLTFESCNYQAQIDAEKLRARADDELNAWRNEFAALGVNPTHADYDRVIKSIRVRMAVIQSFLQRANDTLVTNCATSDPTTTAYRTNLHTALTTVNTAATTITSLQQTIAAQKNTNQTLIATAQSALNNAERDLALKRAGATREDIAAQSAVVKETEANLMNIQAQLNKTIIRAPLNGIISRQDAKLGEIASPNKAIISLISEGAFHVTANVPEVSAAHVMSRNPVTITLDALPGESFAGQVTYVEPAETVVDGVSNYQATIVFTKSDPRIKSGFTANLLIETERHPHALVVPNDAVTENERGAFVQKDINNTATETAVKIGIRDTTGQVEILSGLAEGDKVHVVANKK